MKIYLVKNIDTFDKSFVEKCITFFPKWRKEKMLRYKHLKGQIQCGLGYILLIHALREEGIFKEMPEFSYNEHDKPFLKNYPGWYFNISHSKTAVCCVLSRKEMGIDIEEVGEYKESLAAYICNDKELESLHDSENKADDFYKLWTRKEAVFKMIGSGITNDIKDILDTPYINITSLKVDNIWLTVVRRHQSALLI
mgnify:FL=1